MSANDFYQEIEHPAVPWRKYQLHVPVFYPEILFMSVSILVPLKRIRTMLPSARLKPYRITPWQSTLTITAYQYQESDLGSYNELSIGVPVTIDEETPVLTGVLWRMPKVPKLYVLHLPVTTEIAREVGAEFAGYPKFIADISFRDEGNWLVCELEADGQALLNLRGRKLAVEACPRLRIHPLTFRREYLLRSEFVISERLMGMSKRGADVQLELGDHQIADELRTLNPGKVVSYSYCPHAQGILTPVFESYARR